MKLATQAYSKGSTMNPVVGAYVIKGEEEAINLSNKPRGGSWSYVKT